ncbi:phenazine biosynthesis protein PhzF family [Duganella sp. CF517]|uniref:PhzF family phenazine biosynthesis protein n=1 Tax=Duganella sp. CF517 TaxID=1881038 RepID=UPI0008C08F94|nr:PhzF family phenazine biosynthesis protein [Duganella sp. CF517]SEN36137.1 phenazine biosynthesis protein PhzF family [Duganella sp. CF517]
MTIHQLLCFGTVPGGGNAALVVQHDRSSPDQRQRFARERALPACVFIDTAPDGGVALDYYYPHTRSPLCLHATLAAAQVLLSPQRPSLPVRTALRGQPLTLALAEDGGDVFIELAPQPVEQPALAADLPARLLAAPGLALASTPAVASVGSLKLLLEVADSATLQALRPDLQAIAAWGRAHGVNGCYAWCRRPDGALEGRNFNHLDPALEDAATGVAAGALAVHLGADVTVYQGAHLGQPCRIRAAIGAGGTRVLVGGAAGLATGDGR